MLPAGRDRPRGPAGTERHRPDAGRRLVVADVVRVAATEPAEAAVAPAAHVAVVEQRARMREAGRDRPRRAARAERHRADAVRRLVVADGVRVAVPELSQGALAPAANAAVVEQRARMTPAHGDRARLPPGSQPHRTGAARQLVVPDVLHVAVSQPPTPAVSPAANRAAREDAACPGPTGIQPPRLERPKLRPGLLSRRGRRS